MPIRMRSDFLRSRFERASAISGDPKVTLSAYAETIMPALGMLIWNDCARSGSRPMMTYSEVPMPKAAIVSARMDFRMNQIHLFGSRSLSSIFSFPQSLMFHSPGMLDEHQRFRTQ